MRDMLNRTLFEHPASVDETYFQHMRFALRFAGTLFLAALAALIHAIIPCLCERTASIKINELHNRMHNR